MAAKQRKVEDQDGTDETVPDLAHESGCVGGKTKRSLPFERNQRDTDVDGNIQSTQEMRVCKRFKLNNSRCKTVLESTTQDVKKCTSEAGHGEITDLTKGLHRVKKKKLYIKPVKATGSNVISSTSVSAKENERDACAAPQSHACVRVGDLNPDTIGRFEVLTTSSLTVRYPRKFYKNLLVKIKKKEMIAKLAWWPGNSRAVGCVCCRIEHVKQRLLIMILSTIPTYRRRGVASELVRHVLESVRSIPGLNEIYLHVQTSNTAALAFYQTMGFLVSHEIKNYYRRLNPPHCFVLTRSLLCSDSSDC